MRAEDRLLDDWLDDLLIMSEKIVAYTSDIEYSHFLNNEPLRDLVIKKIENMGEATRYIRELFRDFYETAPIRWRDIRRMRNRLTHGYFDVLEMVLWETARDDIPALLEELRRVIDQYRASAGR